MLLGFRRSVFDGVPKQHELAMSRVELHSLHARSK
jgi:hypothetical protein